MKFISRSLSYLMLAFLNLASFAAAESVIDKSVASDTFKIGVVIPLSGGAATYGERIRKALLFAYDRLPDPQAKKIELLFEDDQLQSTRSVSAFQKLSTIDQVDAVVTFASGAGNALSPLAEQKQIPLIAIGASDFNVVKGRSYVFTHWVMPELEAREMANEIKKRNYKRIAIVFSEQEGLLAFRTALHKELADLGLKDRLVLDETFVQSETDFKSSITKIKAKDADAALIALMPGAVSAFTKQARQLGFKGDFVGFECFEDEAEVKAADGTLLNQWYVNADEGTEQFLNEYKQANQEAAGLASSNAYDTMMLLAEAFSLHGKDRNKVANHLKTVQNFRGAAGTYSASGDNRFELPAAVKIVRESGFERLYR